MQASDPRRKTGRCFSRSLKAEPENHFIERQIVKRNHLIWSLTAAKMILNQNVNNSSSRTNGLYAQGSLLHTQPCRHRTRRLIQNIEFGLQKPIRIKYCPNKFSFGITRQYSGTVAAHRAESGEPIKRFRHSALSDSALSDRQLYSATALGCELNLENQLVLETKYTCM